MRISDNGRQLAIYQVFNALGLAVCSNWIITDMTLLRMDFDLTRFGILKGAMFLLPALAGWFAAGILRRWNRDRQVCMVSYCARVALPLALPLAALATEDREVRFWVAFGVFSLGYTCAMFANNSLLTIYRQALPRKDFNRIGSLLTAVAGPPGSLAALPAAWWLGRVNNESFFQWLLAIQLLLLLAEWPAVNAMRRVQIETTSRPEPLRMREWIQPFGDRNFRSLFTFSVLSMVWSGMLSTYFVVYLLTCRKFGPSWIVLWEFVLGSLVTICASFVGKLADRYGYAKFMAYGASLLVGVSFLWSVFPDSTVIFALFVLLVYNGNSGLIPMSLKNLQGCASSGIAAPERMNHYVATLALGQSLGCFCGCLLAGPLFGAFSGTDEERFLKLFLVIAAGAAAVACYGFYWYAGEKNWFISEAFSRMMFLHNGDSQKRTPL